MLQAPWAEWLPSRISESSPNSNPDWPSDGRGSKPSASKVRYAVGACSFTETAHVKPAGLHLYRNPSPLMSRCTRPQLLGERPCPPHLLPVQQPWSSASDHTSKQGKIPNAKGHCPHLPTTSPLPKDPPSMIFFVSFKEEKVCYYHQINIYTDACKYFYIFTYTKCILIYFGLGRHGIHNPAYPNSWSFSFSAQFYIVWLCYYIITSYAVLFM